MLLWFGLKAKKQQQWKSLEMNHPLLPAPCSTLRFSSVEIRGPLKFNCRSKSKLRTQSLPSCHYLIVVYTGPENKWGGHLSLLQKWPLLLNQKTATGNRFYLNHYLHLWSILYRYHVVFTHTLQAMLMWYMADLLFSNGRILFFGKSQV